MWFLTHAWLIPALPAASFTLVLLFGKRSPGKGHFIGIAAVALAFVLALCTAGAWIGHVNDAGHPSEQATMADVSPRCSATARQLRSDQTSGGASTSSQVAAGAESLTQPVVRCVSWWQNGNLHFTMGTYVDGQAVMLLVVVTLVSLLVHVFSTDYVAGDQRYTHYFGFLSLFTASMLFMVLAENTIQLLTGWELVGLCSFVLIGHWWEEKPNSDAALKAFFTTRVGDVGLMIGVIILFFASGQSFNIIDITTKANDGQINHTTLLVAACCLLLAVMAKSGQFILHTWLPDAMAGPTPVSALIHAATMVVAGVYLVGRLYSVFFNGLSIAHSSINILAVVGSVTAVFGALLAFVQKDIKKVLAYSTISQLGFMVAALGVGAWTAAMFHLFTHAFFKAGLFLCAGSLSHACHHSFNMVDDMGGLRKKMPITFYTYLICMLALSGIFPLAGFWSKDEILAGTGSVNAASGTYHFTLIMLLIGAFCTAAYMMRTIWYAFYGEFRGHGEPRESGPRMAVPLIVLASLAAVAGFTNLPAKFTFLPRSILERFQHYVEPVGAYFPGHGQGLVHAGFNWGLAVGSLAVAVAGLGVVYLYYWQRSLRPIEGLATRNRLARAGKVLLENKYYLDWLYTDVIVGAIKYPIARATDWINSNIVDGVVNTAGRHTVAVAKFVYERIDQGIVDNVVNGSGVVAEGGGGELRRIQTGQVQQYAAVFFAAAAILAAVLIVAVG